MRRYKTREELVEAYRRRRFLRISKRFLTLCVRPRKMFRYLREKKLLTRSAIFDENYYLRKNPDLYYTTANLMRHFLLTGYKAYRNPNAFFDSKYYEETYPDVKKVGMNPVIHYIMYGVEEGKNPHPEFDTLFYLRSYPDVAEKGVNPLGHYIKIGWRKGNRPNPFMVERDCTFLPAFPLQDHSALSIVVVFHIYHEDLVGSCLQYISHIPYPFDLIVTTPLEENNDAILQVKSLYPDAEIVRSKNAGRDIGPFLQVWDRVLQYDLCCKVHTKKGNSAYSEIWRDLSLRGILETVDTVHGILRMFEQEDSLALAGAELLYGSYQFLLGKNKDLSNSLIKDYNIPVNSYSNNGFFMGTMFWMRVKKFIFLSNLKQLQFPIEDGKNDGKYEHALERLLGSLSLHDKKVLLIRNNEENLFSAKMVNCSYESPITTFHEHFDFVLESLEKQNSIKGEIRRTAIEDSAVLSGYLVLNNSSSPREAIIRIDDTIEMDFLCDYSDGDLKNWEGTEAHGFSVNLPPSIMDGQQHLVKLIDKYSGKIVDSVLIKPVANLNRKVRYSYPVWDAWREERFLRFIQDNTDDIAIADKVSIVMPTYNRAAKIEYAIQSVLAQTYRNFELIIVDDGSLDHTSEIVKPYLSDKRVRYIQQTKQGVSAARNTGLRRSTGAFIFFLDSDNAWFDKYLDTMVKYITLVGIDSAYCGIIAIDDMEKRKYYRGDDFFWSRFSLSNYIDLNAFGYRRKANQQLVLFDETLHRLVDWDYILKFTSDNTIAYAPFLGVKYYDGSNEERITNSVYTRSKALNAALAKIRNRYAGVKRIYNDAFYVFENLMQNSPASINNKESSVTVDTIITSFNHEKYIRKAIQSVMEQIGDFHHRIIISDDGSDDATHGAIDSFQKLYPRVISDISSSVNLGLSQNLKKCIAFSQGKYIALCEGDDYWTDPYKLEKQIMFLETNPHCSMVFSSINVLDEATGEIHLLQRQQRLHSEELTGQDFIDDQPTMNLIGNFSCCLFRSDILKRLPLLVFKERINEIAVAFFCEQFGPIGFIKEPMSVYRQHSNGLWSGADKRKQSEESFRIRKIVLEIAADRYKKQIKDLLDKHYNYEL
ncbi:glycosyltransferase [Sediminispirochaeta smaragdinae]|uniref:Glycosyl transferase family 2 n=1 Tax=Sediminispirochaeta smaragdinae (strain DSM 11293 / JCM 15392 / SEBR 4228) TaxID=573413 RepID=E1RBS9_SEDSS|nr:glycosyltransferase [Sediminispirochaeta smaragdinae]ADK79809.1 glycosyl transferase family 2 [Sediminispirochaeta smaragdinae DSM 11293]